MIRTVKKLGRFNIREWMTTINWLIDEVQRLSPGAAPGTLRSTTYKGTRRSASSAVIQNQQTTQQTIPVARWQ
jgi:hypothetical protein